MGTPVVLGDRVLVSFTTTGTGTYQLGSAITGYLTAALAGITSGSRVAYVAVDSLTAPTAFEVGEGVYTSGSPAQLTRATIRRNTSGGTSAVSWSAGTKYIQIAPSTANLAMLETDGSLTLAGGIAMGAALTFTALADFYLSHDITGGKPGVSFAANDFICYDLTNNFLQATIGGTEVLRLTSAGLYIGDLSGSSSNTGIIRAKGFNVRSGLSGSLGANVYNVAWTGSAAELYIDSTSLGTVNTTSDRRLKHQIADLGDVLDDVALLQLRTYRWLDGGIYVDDGADNIGVIADEVQAVFPAAVRGEPDAEDAGGNIIPQSVNDRALIAIALKAVQELRARVIDLEARLAAEASATDAAA